MIRLYPGEQQAFGADGHYGENRRRLPPEQCTWSVEPPSLGEFAEDGTFTARSFGNGNIICKWNDLLRAEFPIEVAPPGTPEPTISAISIVPC